MIKTAVIIAGGLGTRLKPLTLKIPKPLVPVKDKTLIDYAILKLKEAGISKLYLSIGYMHEKIIDYCQQNYKELDITYIIEKEPLGTGGWMNLIRKEQIKKDFNQDFIVINGDNLFDLNWDKFIKEHIQNNALITIALTKVQDVSSFGVAKLDKNKILEFIEKPKKEDAPSNFINSGYYIFSKDIFDFLPNESKFMLEKNLFPSVSKIGKLFGYYDSSKWFDTGTFENLNKVNQEWLSE